MSTNDRSTHFLGFADLLIEELMSFQDMDDRPRARTVIAARAYDLVQHTIGYSLEYLHECGHELSGGMGKRIQPTIPDMTTWPEENKR
jgi:hypothetical protein